MTNLLRTVARHGVGWLRVQKTRLYNWAIRNRLVPIAPLVRDHVWLREPPVLAAQKVCLLATFSSGTSVSEHTLLLSKRWAEQGFAVILIVATEHPQRIDLGSKLPGHPDLPSHLRGVMVRQNSGYDFGSWATLIQSRRDLLQASMLVLANDSLYGPFDGFPELLERVDASEADVVGLTDSYEYQHHLQSFVVFYKGRALASETFRKFWEGVRGGNREETIQSAELQQLAILKKGGLNVEILFPTVRYPLTNPTLCDWRPLLDRGFPFIKVQLLRENPFEADITGWDRIMRERGYDPAIVREHLGERFASSAASRAAVGA